MKKEIPILFSTPMVQAILQGRKTMTRRIVKFPKDYDGTDVYPNGEFGCKYSSTMMGGTVQRLFSKWAKGDILYVRESWRYAGGFSSKPDHSVMKPSDFIYKADEDWNGPFKPSIHLPKTGSRIWLEVTDVRVERLHKISSHDAQWEGFEENGQPFICRFQNLWNEINGNWDANPWVWVISFKVLSTTGKPSESKPWKTSAKDYDFNSRNNLETSHF